MKKFGKILCLFAVLFLLAFPAFSEIPGLGDLQGKVDEFTEKMAESLPFNSTMGLNWSDAYIGQLFALPPHLGLGLTTGFTTINFGSLNELLKMFDIHEFDQLTDKMNVGGFTLPGYTIDARIGGFILPFDIGVKFGYLKLNPDFINGLLNTDIPDFNMDYLIIGGDLRYAVLDGKKFPLKLSVGAGFNYLRGGISMPVPGVNEIKFDIGDTGNTLYIPTPKIGLDWETKALDFKAQASIKLLILTPYIGLGATHAWSRVGYGVTSDINVKDSSGNPVDIDNVRDAIEKFGIEGLSANGFSHYVEDTGWSFRTFGGFSINVPFVRFDLTGMYDFISKCYGLTFGVRLQL